MALCSFSKSSNELALGQQQRALGHRSALRPVRTRVAQPSTATPSSATFELRKTLVQGNHFTQPQAETLLNVFPTMKDVASKDDITRLERTMDSRFDQMDSRFGQIQLLAVLLALAVVVIVGLVAGALMLLPVNPSSAFGMVVSAFVKKNI